MQNLIKSIVFHKTLFFTYAFNIFILKSPEKSNLVICGELLENRRNQCTNSVSRAIKLRPIEFFHQIHDQIFIALQVNYRENLSQSRNSLKKNRGNLLKKGKNITFSLIFVSETLHSASRSLNKDVA